MSVEDGSTWTTTLFCDCAPVFSGPQGQAIEKQRRPWLQGSSLLLYPRWFMGRFFNWPQALSNSIGFWRWAHLLASFISLNHLSPVFWLTWTRIADLRALSSKEYVSFRRFVYDLYDSMHRDFALHLAIASEGKQNCAERREASTDRNGN